MFITFLMNNTMTRTTLLLACSLFASALAAQPAFLNGGLDGLVASNPPTGWQDVPHTSPISMASGSPYATVDVLSATGYSLLDGLAGNPYEGTTFVSGLYANSPGFGFYDEGIQQQVTGFVPGQPYTVTFRQSVTKQSHFRDSSGYWAVFVDNQWIGRSATCVDSSALSSQTHPWILAGVSFYATATSHTIQFLPRDEDISRNGTPDIRMGIDDIALADGANYPIGIATPWDAVTLDFHDRQLQIQDPQGGEFDVQLIDMQGRLAFAAKAVRQADLSRLAAGVYVVMLQGTQAMPPFRPRRVVLD